MKNSPYTDTLSKITASQELKQRLKSDIYGELPATPDNTSSKTRGLGWVLRLAPIAMALVLVVGLIGGGLIYGLVGDGLPQPDPGRASNPSAIAPPWIDNGILRWYSVEGAIGYNVKSIPPKNSHRQLSYIHVNTNYLALHEDDRGNSFSVSAIIIVRLDYTIETPWSGETLWNSSNRPFGFIAYTVTYGHTNNRYPIVDKKYRCSCICCLPPAITRPEIIPPIVIPPIYDCYCFCSYVTFCPEVQSPPTTRPELIPPIIVGGESWLSRMISSILDFFGIPHYIGFVTLPETLPPNWDCCDIYFSTCVCFCQNIHDCILNK